MPKKNLATRNISHDVRLRAGFNMVQECGDELVYPQRHISVRGGNCAMTKDEYRRAVKQYRKLKSKQ